MKAPTLLGDLLRAQTVVAVLSAVLVGLGGTGATAILLRKHQDRILRSLGKSLCRTIEQEQKEDPGFSFSQAAHDAFREMDMSSYLFEIEGRNWEVVAREGTLEGWTSVGLARLKQGDCVTRGKPSQQGLAGAFRACAHYCDQDHRVLVAASNIHGDPDIRLAVQALFGTILLVLGAGVFVGRSLIRRRLRPLQRLAEAVTRLQSESGAALGVGAKSTELARLEGAIDGLLRQLHQALQREKRFSQEASHELRTSLTVLRTRVEGMRSGMHSQPQLQHEADALISNLDALDRLVEALLLLARSEEDSGVPTSPVNLCDLAREAAEERKQADGAGSPPPEVIAPDEILVMGSEDLIGRALFNLMENARKFGGAGARILIRVAKENAWAQVTVEDDGPGIPRESRPYVFERFYRDPSRRGLNSGTGLGLAVVRSIAVRHRGNVSTGPSETLGGEAVRLWLPILGAEDSWRVL
jgi:signal transduction histidine kinase